MQTFLPYPNFALSAHSLDWRRLGKQRVEAMQIHRVLTDPVASGSGWSSHPAVLMWRGYERSLALYHDCCIREWIRRGYTNNMPLLFSMDEADQLVEPWWLGYDKFHSSHRAALLHKDREWYGQFSWPEAPLLDYWWPSQHEDTHRAYLHPQSV